MTLLNTLIEIKTKQEYEKMKPDIFVAVHRFREKSKTRFSQQYIMNYFDIHAGKPNFGLFYVPDKFKGLDVLVGVFIEQENETSKCCRIELAYIRAGVPTPYFHSCYEDIETWAKEKGCTSLMEMSHRNPNAMRKRLEEKDYKLYAIVMRKELQNV